MLRAFEDPAGDLGRALEGAAEGRAVLRPADPDHAGKRLRIPLDRSDALAPNRPEASGPLGMMHELLKEGCCERGTQRGDAASAKPGTPTRHLL